LNVVSNPYLEEFLALGELLNYPALTDPGEYYAARSKVVAKRRVLVEKFSWSIPSPKALETIARFSPIIEIAAGSGYWSSLLNQMGVDVRAYDIWQNADDEKLRSNRRKEKWINVELGSSEAVLKHPQHTLFLCWPPVDVPVAYQALNLYRGKYLLYNGDADYEPFGNHTFYTELNRGWKLIETVEIPKWPEVDDRLYVYERN
jgi:hypothetical protein